MRIRVIVEDDEGKVIGEGNVPVSVLPDANREMLDALREIAKQMRESQSYVPVYPEPYIPQYRQPGFGPCGGWNHDIEDPK